VKALAALPALPAPNGLRVRLDAAVATLAARLAGAKADFDAGNFTNTASLAEAEAAFQTLADLLAGAAGALRSLVEQDLLQPDAFSARLSGQFEELDQVEIIDLGNIKDKFTSALKKIEDAVAGVDLNAVTDGIEKVFATIDGLIAKIDLRQFASTIGDLKAQIESALEAIDGALLEAIAAIRSVFTTICDAIRSVASNLGSYDADGTFHYTVKQQIREFLADIASTLHDTVQPTIDRLKQTVGETLQQVQQALEAVKGEIDCVKSELQRTLQGIHDELQGVDVEGTMASIRDALNGMLDRLGTIDFDVVVGPVVAEIDEMRDSLKKIDVSKLSDFMIGALKVSVEIVVHLDFSSQITAVVMAEIDKLLEYPEQALAEVEGKVEGAIKQFGELAPGVLLAPLNDLFAPVTEQLNQVKLEALLEPLDTRGSGRWKRRSTRCRRRRCCSR
jgi:phage-related protein